MNSRAIKNHIDYWLRRVNLAKSADRNKYSKSYSGGMKRRLGVAMSIPEVSIHPRVMSSPPSASTFAEVRRALGLVDTELAEYRSRALRPW